MGPDTRGPGCPSPCYNLYRIFNHAHQRRIVLSLNGGFLEGAVTYVPFPFAHWADFRVSMAPGPKCGCRVMAPNDRLGAPIVQANNNNVVAGREYVDRKSLAEESTPSKVGKINVFRCNGFTQSECENGYITTCGIGGGKTSSDSVIVRSSSARGVIHRRLRLPIVSRGAFELDLRQRMNQFIN